MTKIFIQDVHKHRLEKKEKKRRFVLCFYASDLLNKNNYMATRKST